MGWGGGGVRGVGGGRESICAFIVIKQQHI